MGLDMNFSYSKTRIPLNKINSAENGWEYFKENTEDVYYFRKFYDLHDFIIGLYKEDDPDGYEKYGDNGTFIELTTEILEKLEDWIWNNKEDTEDIDENLDEFYRIVCEMIFRTKHGEHFYYEGDY